MKMHVSRRWSAAAGIAVALAVATPALASATGSAAGANNLGGASAAVHAVRAAAPNTIAAAHAFPSASSTVIASTGFVDSEQVGYFWSAARGDSVAETFSGPAHVKKIILKLDVVSNGLAAGAHVDWAVSVNGTDVGTFTVVSGQTGPLTEKDSFAPIGGGSYAVKIRVTNEVAGGDGAHTLRYAGAGPHSVKLKG